MLHTIEKNRNESGFTLVELSIAIIIFGIIFAIGVTMMSNYLRVGKERKTISSFETLADSISLYAQANYRVPCPSTADASSANYGLEAVNANGDCTGQEEGILPFRTLGLSEDSARDAFGQVFTYRISPAATLSAARPQAFWNALDIGQWCMTQPNWHDGTKHLNLPKAAFCCGSNYNSGGTDTRNSTDIEVRGINGALPPNRIGISYLPDEKPQVMHASFLPVPSFFNKKRENIQQAAAGLPPPPSEYTTVTDPTPTQSDLQGTTQTTYIAYAIISHGENGFNAFVNDGNRPAAAGSAEERENADGDTVLFASDRVSTQVGAVNLNSINFDDLVYWQSASQVMSRFGGVSCNRP